MRSACQHFRSLPTKPAVPSSSRPDTTALLTTTWTEKSRLPRPLLTFRWFKRATYSTRCDPGKEQRSHIEDMPDNFKNKNQNEKELCAISRFEHAKYSQHKNNDHKGIKSQTAKVVTTESHCTSRDRFNSLASMQKWAHVYVDLMGAREQCTLTNAEICWNNGKAIPLQMVPTKTVVPRVCPCLYEALWSEATRLLKQWVVQ